MGLTNTGHCQVRRTLKVGENERTEKGTMIEKKSLEK